MLIEVNRRDTARYQPVKYEHIPAGFDPLIDIPGDFLDFLLPLHKEFTPIQKALAAAPQLVNHLFDEELDRILRELPPETDAEVIEKYRKAKRISEEMITLQRFNPV